MSDGFKDIRDASQKTDAPLREMLSQMRQALHWLRDNTPTIRALQGAGLADERGRLLPIDLSQIAVGAQGPAGDQGPPGAGVEPPDLTQPPTPTGLTAVGALASVIAQWGNPSYTAGHGHKQTNIYATKQPAADATLYTIADAVRVSAAPGAQTIASVASDPDVKWRIWIKWESNDGVESPPAGGVNGVVATTGQDVSSILSVLSGELTATQLASSLATPIALIPSKTQTFRQAAVPTAVATGDLWIDTGSTNLLLRSQEFGDSYWEKVSATVFDNAVSAPDGSTTAEKIIESAATADHALRLSSTSLSAGQHVLSIYAKAAERTTLTLYKNNSGSNEARLFNLSTGTTSANGIGYGNATGYGMEDVGGGWWRCWILVNSTGGSSGVGFLLQGASYAGDGTSGLYLWGAQLEQASAIGRYIPTTSASVSTVGNNQTLRWSGSAWVLSDDARIGATAAAVTTEITNRINGDAANASLITTVQSSVQAQRAAGASIWPDPHILDAAAWQAAIWGALPSIVTLSDGVSGTKAFRSPSGSWASARGVKRVPLTEDRKYRVSAKVRRTADANGVFYLRLDRGTAETGAYEELAIGVEVITPTTSWATYSGEFTAASTQKFGSPMVLLNLSGTLGYMEAQDVRIEDVTEATTLAASVQTEAATRASQDGLLFAKYGVKLDVNGYTIGWAANNDGVQGTIVFRTDTFIVGGTGYSPVQPFIIRTSSGTEGGVSYPAGVYMDSAYITNLTAMWARFGTLVADSVQATEISAARLTVGTGAIGGNLRSTTYTGGSIGWIVRPDGYAEFNDVVVRGTVYASAGAIGGSYIGSTYIQSTTWVSGSNGWRFNSDGTGWVGGIYMDTTSIRSANYILNSQGFALRADGTGQIGGLKVNADSIESSNYVAGTSGMRINYNGDVEIDNLTARGNITANHLDAASGTFAGTMTAAAVNAVDSINIKDNAVVVPVSATWLAPLGSNGNDTWVASTPSFDARGGAVAITATVVITAVSGTGFLFYSLRIYRDGWQVQGFVDTLLGGAGTSVSHVVTATFVDTPPPGSHSYQIGGSNGTNNNRITQASLSCVVAIKLGPP